MSRNRRRSAGLEGLAIPIIFLCGVIAWTCAFYVIGPSMIEFVVTGQVR